MGEIGSFEQQIHESRMYARENGIEVDTVYCSEAFYLNLVREIADTKLHYVISEDSSMKPRIHGLVIIRSNNNDRFWLEGKGLYAVVPDGVTSWRLDYAANWQVFKRVEEEHGSTTKR